MGVLIGILSTVILVSTVCTLIFAIGAYIVARSSREGVNEVVTDGELPGEDTIADQFPHSDSVEIPKSGEPSLFKWNQPSSSATSSASKLDDEYQWK